MKSSSVQSPKLCVTIRKKEMGASLCLDCVCGGGTRALNWYLDLLWIVWWSQRERDETVWAFPCAETENRFPGREPSLREKTEPRWTHTHTLWHMWTRTLSMKDLTKIDEDWWKMKDWTHWKWDFSPLPERSAVIWSTSATNFLFCSLKQHWRISL